MEHKHGFTMDESISEKVETLKGPAFDVEHSHKFPAEGKLEVSGQPPPREMQVHSPLLLLTLVIDYFYHF